MFEIADKPFLHVLGEDVRYDLQQSLFSNVGENLVRAGDKVITRNRWRNRARQMNQTMAAYNQQQAALRQRTATMKMAHLRLEDQLGEIVAAHDLEG
jgi:hypothetical protein